MKLATLFLLCTLGWAQDVPLKDLYCLRWVGDSGYMCKDHPFTGWVTYTSADGEEATFPAPSMKREDLPIDFKPIPQPANNDCWNHVGTSGLSFKPCDKAKPAKTGDPNRDDYPLGTYGLVGTMTEAKPSPESKVMPNVSKNNTGRPDVTGGRRSGQRADDCECASREYWQARFNFIRIGDVPVELAKLPDRLEDFNFGGKP